MSTLDDDDDDEAIMLPKGTTVDLHGEPPGKIVLTFENEDGPPQNVLSPTLSDRFLMAVREARRRQDERHGFLRDYRDGTQGTALFVSTPEDDAIAPHGARRALADALHAGRPSWRHYLELACADLYSIPPDSRLSEGDLKRQLVEVAAAACAWAEGLEVRHDDRRIALEQKAMTINKHGRIVSLRSTFPWWRRLWSWLTRRPL